MVPPWLRARAACVTKYSRRGGGEPGHLCCQAGAASTTACVMDTLAHQLARDACYLHLIALHGAAGLWRARVDSRWLAGQGAWLAGGRLTAHSARLMCAVGACNMGLCKEKAEFESCVGMSHICLSRIQWAH
jgi:hypothetical protein